MIRSNQPSLTMIERIECALVLLAYFIELDGDVYLPMYEKFEAELAELRSKDATRERARRLLLTHTGAAPGSCNVMQLAPPTPATKRAMVTLQTLLPGAQSGTSSG